MNVALGFVLKNLEDESYNCYNAHKKNRLLERSRLVATAEDLEKIKNLMSNTDVIDLCTRERSTTRWIFYKLTEVTNFAALLKEVYMGCKDTVLPYPPLKNKSSK